LMARDYVNALCEGAEDDDRDAEGDRGQCPRSIAPG
jgi:hypothetical protein